MGCFGIASGKGGDAAGSIGDIVFLGFVGFRFAVCHEPLLATMLSYISTVSCKPTSRTCRSVTCVSLGTSALTWQAHSRIGREAPSAATANTWNYCTLAQCFLRRGTHISNMAMAGGLSVVCALVEDGRGPVCPVS